MAADQPVQLHCFAHAGAGATAFLGWQDQVGPGVEVVAVRLPGREARRREPRLTDRAGLLGDLLEPLARSARSGPYALYGHSLGALVAYTLARALSAAGVPPPLLLAVGACMAPDAVPAALGGGDRLPDEEMLAFLAGLGSLPVVPGAGPGGLWRRTVLPVLRDDLRLASALRRAGADPALGGPVEVPVIALGGRDDPLVAPGALGGWRQWTRGPFAAHAVAGDHFFVRGQDAPRLVGRACRQAARTPVPAAAGGARLAAAGSGPPATARPAAGASRP